MAGTRGGPGGYKRIDRRTIKEVVPARGRNGRGLPTTRYQVAPYPHQPSVVSPARRAIIGTQQVGVRSTGLFRLLPTEPKTDLKPAGERGSKYVSRFAQREGDTERTERDGRRFSGIVSYQRGHGSCRQCLPIIAGDTDATVHKPSMTSNSSSPGPHDSPPGEQANERTSDRKSQGEQSRKDRPL